MAKQSVVTLALVQFDDGAVQRSFYAMAMGPCGRGAMGPYHPMVKWRNMER